MREREKLTESETVEREVNRKREGKTERMTERGVRERETEMVGGNRD